MASNSGVRHAHFLHFSLHECEFRISNNGGRMAECEYRLELCCTTFVTVFYKSLKFQMVKNVKHQNSVCAEVTSFRVKSKWKC